MTSTTFNPCICGFCKKDFENLETFCHHLKTHDTCYSSNKFFCDFLDSKNLCKVEKVTCMKCSNKFETICVLHKHICDCFPNESYIYVSEDRLVYPLEQLSSFFDTREDICVDLELSSTIPQTSSRLGFGSLLKIVLKQIYKNQTDNFASKSTDLETFDQIKGQSTGSCNIRATGEAQLGAESNEAKNMSTSAGMKKDIKRGKTEIKQKISVKTKRKTTADSKFAESAQKVNKLNTSDKKPSKKSKCIASVTDSTYNKALKMKRKASSVKKKVKRLTEIAHEPNKSCANEKIENVCSEETISENGVCINAPCCDISDKLDENKCVFKESSMEDDIIDISHPNDIDLLLTEKNNDGNNITDDKYTSMSIIQSEMSESSLQSEKNEVTVSMLRSAPKREKQGRREPSFETCSVCGKMILKSKMKHHAISHSDVRPHKCDLCPKTYKYRSHLEHHMQTHKDTLSYYCEVCGQGFVMEERLKNHLFTHTDFRPFSCNICGAGFINRSRLNRHMNFHTGKKREQCDRCGMRFMNTNNLRTHISRVHEKERKFACDKCDKTFITNYELKCHSMSHSGFRPYKCSLCKADFIQRKELRRHMLKQHNTSLDDKQVPDFPKTMSQPENINDDSQQGQAVKVEQIHKDIYEKRSHENKHVVPVIVKTEMSNNREMQQTFQPIIITEQIQTNQNTSTSLNLCQYEPLSYNTMDGMDSAMLNNGSTYSLIVQGNSQGIDY